MSPEKAFNVVINAAVAHWAAATKRYETARSFRPHSETDGENVTYHALGVAWRKSRPIGVRSQ